MSSEDIQLIKFKQKIYKRNKHIFKLKIQNNKIPI